MCCNSERHQIKLPQNRNVLCEEVDRELLAWSESNLVDAQILKCLEQQDTPMHDGQWVVALVTGGEKSKNARKLDPR